MASRIENLLERQAEALDRLQDREVARFLRTVEDARREVRERLLAVSDVDTFSGQRLRVAMASLESASLQLRSRLHQQMGEQVRTQQERALDDLIQLISLAEPQFRDAGQGIRVAALQRLNAEAGLALHRHSIERYGTALVERMQREIVIGFAEGLSIDQLAKRVAGTDSVFTSMNGRAELIVRMEVNRAYNDAHLVGIETASENLDLDDDPDPLLKRIDEFKDKRNHPISIPLDKLTAPVDEPFRVSVAAVQRAALVLRKGMGGILWKQVGSNFVGMNLPAHFGERGRVVAWRASWG